jgi:hypothetical protein
MVRIPYHQPDTHLLPSTKLEVGEMITNKKRIDRATILFCSHGVYLYIYPNDSDSLHLLLAILVGCATNPTQKRTIFSRNT